MGSGTLGSETTKASSRLVSAGGKLWAGGQGAPWEAGPGSLGPHLSLSILAVFE